jgi:hypothetical protein
MHQKICILTDAETILTLADDPLLVGTIIVSSTLDGKTFVAMIYPKHAHTRFAIGSDKIIVLPGCHDPAPIGEVHKHLAHIKAEPHHTMRDVALRLHDAHGSAFHPDT